MFYFNKGSSMHFKSKKRFKLNIAAYPSIVFEADKVYSFKSEAEFKPYKRRIESLIRHGALKACKPEEQAPEVKDSLVEEEQPEIVEEQPEIVEEPKIEKKRRGRKPKKKD